MDILRHKFVKNLLEFAEIFLNMIFDGFHFFFCIDFNISAFVCIFLKFVTFHIQIYGFILISSTILGYYPFCIENLCASKIFSRRCYVFLLFFTCLCFHGCLIISIPCPIMKQRVVVQFFAHTFQYFYCFFKLFQCFRKQIPSRIPFFYLFKKLLLFFRVEHKYFIIRHTILL